MTTLVMSGIVLFGVAGYRGLPVSDLPNVDFPTISVNANLPGASPETMAASVATPLERQFSTIPGLDSMSSSSTRGSTSVTLQFTLDRPLDAAAQDVQAAIAIVQRRLPSGMPTPPTLRKVNPADQPILNFSLNSPTLPLSVVDDYAETMISQRISMLSGVAQVNVYGAQKYAVRAQLDPNLLAARGIPIEDVETALAKHNVNLPTGTLWGPKQSFTVQASGQLETAEKYRPADRRLPQWRACPPGTARPRHRQRRKRQGGQLVQRSPLHHPGGAAPARHQHGGGGGPYPRPAAHVSGADAPLRESRHRLRPFGIHPRVGQRCEVHAAALDHPGGARHLPVPAQLLGDPHPQPGPAPRHHRDLRRHVPAGLHAGQSLADGPHPLRRLRGGRRHRDAGKHRAPHGDGQRPHGGGPRGIARNRLYHPLDDPLAGGGVHPRAVHERHPGAPVQRIRRHHHGGHPHLGLRVAEPDAHVVQPLPDPAGRPPQRFLPGLGGCLRWNAVGL